MTEKRVSTGKMKKERMNETKKARAVKPQRQRENKEVQQGKWEKESK